MNPHKAYCEGYEGVPMSSELSEADPLARRAHVLGVYHRSQNKAPLMTEEAVRSRVEYLISEECRREQYGYPKKERS